MTRRIGGLMDYSKLMPAEPAVHSTESESQSPVQHRPPQATYDLLIDRAAIAHRPKDQAGLRAAACDLAASGLREADIAAALGIGIEAARALLQPSGQAGRS